MLGIRSYSGHNANEEGIKWRHMDCEESNVEDQIVVDGENNQEDEDDESLFLLIAKVGKEDIKMS